MSAEQINTTLNQIKERARGMTPRQVQALTRRLREINEGLRQPSTTANLNGNGRRDANPYEDSIPAPTRDPERETGGQHHADEEAGWERNAV